MLEQIDFRVLYCPNCKNVCANTNWKDIKAYNLCAWSTCQKPICPNCNDKLCLPCREQYNKKEF